MRSAVATPRRGLQIMVLAALVWLLPSAATAEEPLDLPAPAVAPAKQVSFEQALERSLSQNPSARQAQQQILRAEALVREARAASLPTLTGNAVGTLLDSERKLGTQVVAGQTSLALNVSLALPLVAVQRWMSWIHTRDQAEVTKVSAAEVRRSLAVATARAYLAVLAQKKGLEVADRAFSTAQKHYDFAHGRRLGGVGNRLDEVRAEQERETTRASAELARSSLARAQEALGVVLAEDGPVDTASEAVLPAPPAMDEALKDVAARRTDVQLAESRSAAAAKVVSDGWADFMPTLTGTFQPFYQNPPSITQPETGWQAQLLIGVPFYDGGFRYGARQERDALAADAKIAVEAVSRQVQADVRAAYEALRRSDASLQAAQRSARLAAEALELATQAYSAGATTNLEVIDAERRARDAESAAAIAEDSARQARLDLLAASGRFP